MEEEECGVSLSLCIVKEHYLHARRRMWGSCVTLYNKGTLSTWNKKNVGLVCHSVY